MKKIHIIKLSDIAKKDRKRVFIENDLDWDFRDDDEVEELEQDFGLTIKELFPLFIGEASEKVDVVLKAIIENDDIFIQTSFVGNSSQLFNKMLQACVELKIKGKRIFNFLPSKYLTMDGVSAELYWKVAKDNLFYYRNDYHPNKSFVLSKVSK